MKSKRNIILLLGLLVSVGPLSIDMYLPAFSTLQTIFATTESKVQLTLSLFFLGFSAGQLIYGPLSDQWGRKPLLYVGLIAYFIASIGCARSTSIESLIFWRFLQALGGCAGIVLGRAMVRDLFETNEIAHVFSLITLVMGLAPILAPVIGGQVLALLSWSWIFYCLAFFALVSLALTYFVLPETKKSGVQRPMSFSSVFSDYKILLLDSSFMRFALAGSFVQAGMFAYIAGSPFILMEYYGVSEKQYGLFFGANAFALIFLSQMNRRLLKSYNFSQMLNGSLLILIAIGCYLSISAVQSASLIFFAVGLFFYVGMMGLVFPNSTAGALADQSNRAGSASALLGTMQFTLASISSYLVGFFHDGTARPMSFIMLVSGLAGLGIFAILKENRSVVSV